MDCKKCNWYSVCDVKIKPGSEECVSLPNIIRDDPTPPKWSEGFPSEGRIIWNALEDIIKWRTQMKRPKPIALHLIDGKKHFSKAEIQQRKDAQVRIGNDFLDCPDYVQDDKIAYKKWCECKDIYEFNKDFDLITSGDAGCLGRYCRTFSEYQDLVKRRDAIAKTLLEGDESRLLSIDKAINSKLNALTAMEDRLFLNPMSKIKTQAKKAAQQPQTPVEKAGFEL